MKDIYLKGQRPKTTFRSRDQINNSKQHTSKELDELIEKIKRKKAAKDE